MPRKRFGAEQIIPMLREAEVDLAKGLTVAQVCKKIGKPLVDEQHAICRPSQLLSETGECVLALTRLTVFSNLMRRRLPDVDDRQSVQMAVTNLTGRPYDGRTWRDSRSFGSNLMAVGL